jgi:hypothetical protein
MTEIIVRNVEIIAAEIISIENQTRNIVLSSAIDVGTRLLEAKDQLPHGKWGKWLQESVNYSQSKANSLMQVSREYGGKFLALGNLGFTQAVALLSVPEEDREQFVEENDIESMTTRELQQAIKDNELLKEQLTAANEATAEIERQALEDITAKTKAHDELVLKLNTDLTTAQAAGDNSTARKLKTDLTQAKTDHNEAIKRIKELETELKKEPIDIAKIEIPEETQKELETLRQRETELSELAKRLEEDAKKQVTELQEQIRKNNNTAGIKVKLYFQSLTTNFDNLISSIGEIENEEQQTAVKARIFTLCDEMKGKL